MYSHACIHIYIHCLEQYILLLWHVVELTCLPQACPEEVVVSGASSAGGGDQGVGGRGEEEEACLQQEPNRKERGGRGGEKMEGKRFGVNLIPSLVYRG